MVGVIDGAVRRAADEVAEEGAKRRVDRAARLMSSASSAVSSKFGPSIAKFGAQCDDLLKQTVAQLAAGALAISARVVSTRNEMEGTMLSEKIVTKYVLEVSQLGFKWEVARRYSEFAAFNEALSATWMMPELPPKILFNQERIQILRDAWTRG